MFVFLYYKCDISVCVLTSFLHKAWSRVCSWWCVKKKKRNSVHIHTCGVMCAASRHVFRSAPVPPWPWNRRAVEDDWHWFAVECLHFYNLDHSWTLQLSMAESFCMETLTADTFSKTDLTKHVNPLGNTPVWCDTDASVNKKVTKWHLN